MPSARLRQQRLAQGHAWDGLHGLFDLAQLDAIPFKLHLVVLPPGIIQVAVPSPPSSVAGAVHGGRWLQQVGAERLGCQLRLVHVAASDPCPGDPDVTGLAWAEEFPFFIQHVDPGVLHGSADGQDVVLRFPLGVHRKEGGLHGTLGGAVAVDHQAMGTAPEKGVQNGLLQLLPTGQVELEPEGLFRVGGQCLVEQLHHQGRAIADVQAVQRLSQCQRAEFGLVGDDVQGVSAQQSREDLLHRQVKGKGRRDPHLQPSQRQQPEGFLLHLCRQVEQGALPDDGAFGASGGAGGEAEVGVLSAAFLDGREVGQGDGAPCQQRPIGQDGTGEVGGGLCQPLQGDHSHRLRLLHHVRQPHLRQMLVQRQVMAPRLPNAQHRGQMLHRPAAEQRHAVAWLAPQCLQPLTELVGLLRQLAVGDLPGAADHGQLHLVLSGDGLEGLRHGGVGQRLPLVAAHLPIGLRAVQVPIGGLHRAGICLVGVQDEVHQLGVCEGGTALGEGGEQSTWEIHHPGADVGSEWRLGLLDGLGDAVVFVQSYRVVLSDFFRLLCGHHHGQQRLWTALCGLQQGRQIQLWQVFVPQEEERRFIRDLRTVYREDGTHQAGAQVDLDVVMQWDASIGRAEIALYLGLLGVDDDMDGVHLTGVHAVIQVPGQQGAALDGEHTFAAAMADGADAGAISGGQDEGLHASSHAFHTSSAP